MSLAEKIRSLCQAAGYGYEAFWYQRGPGLGEVAAWHLTPREKAKSMVVFVHGTGSDALLYQVAYFFKLLELGYEVFSFDLDGHGSSSSTLWHPEGMQTCLDAALEQADLRAQSRTRHLVGYSLGGALLLAYLAKVAGLEKTAGLAKTASPAVTSAVVIACPLSLGLEGWMGTLLAESRFLWRASFYRHLNYYGPLGIWPAVGALRRKSYPIRLFSEGQNEVSKKALTYVDEVRALLLALQLEAIAERVRTPTLLCYSPLDTLAPLSHGQILADRMPCSSFLEVREETHLTTMLSPVVEERLCSWLQTWT